MVKYNNSKTLAGVWENLIVLGREYISVICFEIDHSASHVRNKTRTVRGF